MKDPTIFYNKTLRLLLFKFLKQFFSLKNFLINLKLFKGEIDIINPLAVFRILKLGSKFIWPLFGPKSSFHNIKIFYRKILTKFIWPKYGPNDAKRLRTKFIANQILY